MENKCEFPASILKVAVAAALLSAPVNGALAQASAGATAGVLEEVIVTARKREESLQDTPVVISALSSRTINDFAIESMEDIADFTPGMLNTQRENQTGGVLALRGIGSSANSPIIDQAVSLVVDDMQVGSLQVQRHAILDMESVQVYKGPQALFFGKNSPGGVLSIRSADPGDEFEAQVKTGYEFEAEEWFVQGMVSAPISDTVGGRLVARYSEADGYFDVDDSPYASFDQGPESEDVFVRGTLVFEPTDDLTIRTKLTYADRESGAGFNIQRHACPLGSPQLSLPFKCEGNDTAQLSDFPQAAIDALATVDADTDTDGNLDNELWLATVGLDYAISDNLTLTSVTGYYDNEFVTSGSSTFSLIPAYLAPQNQLDFEQITQELRLASSFDGPVNFVAGLFYENKEHDSRAPLAGDLQVLAGFPSEFWTIVGNTEFEQDTDAYSAFVDLSWDITENLQLSGGARYSYEEKDFTGKAGIIGEDDEDWDNVSPQVTLSWHASDEWMLFASYREGFKSGGFDGSFQFSPTTDVVTYDEEEVEGFEVGAKGTLFDNTLQVNAAIYSYDYTGLQLANFNAVTLSAVVFNAGDAEIEGAELDFVWVTPVDGLQARGAIAYNDSELDDVLSDCYGGQTIALGCDQNLVGGVFQSQDISGNPLALAPEVTGSLGLSYEQNFSNVVLGVSMDVNYTDDYWPSYLYNPVEEQDSFTQVNAAIRLSSVNDTWSAALVGRNLTDEYPVITGANDVTAGGSGTGTDGPATPADVIGTFSPGQTLFLEFEYNFR